MLRFSLRIPKQLHEKIKELADRNRRSMNNQIIYMLGQQIDVEEFGDRWSEKLKGEDDVESPLA